MLLRLLINWPNVRIILCINWLPDCFSVFNSHWARAFGQSSRRCSIVFDSTMCLSDGFDAIDGLIDDHKANLAQSNSTWRQHCTFYSDDDDDVDVRHCPDDASPLATGYSFHLPYTLLLHIFIATHWLSIQTADWAIEFINSLLSPF